MSSITRPTRSSFLHGVGIDLGGIGKGAAADASSPGSRQRGVVAACVSLGGDVHTFGAGHDASGHGWGVPVLSPPSDGAHVMCTREIHDGAIVTSTTATRRWKHRGRPRAPPHRSDHRSRRRHRACGRRRHRPLDGTRRGPGHGRVRRRPRARRGPARPLWRRRLVRPARHCGLGGTRATSRGPSYSAR